MSRKWSFLRTLCLLLVVIYCAGATGIALYPFQNRNLKMVIETTEGEYSRLLDREEIKNGECRILELPDGGRTEIRRLQYYGCMRSVLLKELGYNKLSAYIDNVENGETVWTDHGILFTGTDEIKVHMNEAYQEMLVKMSASRMQERIILLGYWSVFTGFLIIAVFALREHRMGNGRDNHGPVSEGKRFWRDITKYRQYIMYSAKADLRAEVADSYLNRLWWLLEPCFNMGVYVVVFGNVLGNSVENYATSIFSSLLMWNFFSKVINYSVKLVRSNKDIISKVYIPKFVILLSDMILNLSKLLFSMIVLAVMLLVFHVPVRLSILWVIPAYAVMILLGFGLGMICLHFGVYVDDLSYAVGILLNIMMFLSGIFYNVMTTLPEPLNGILMCLNPVAMVIDTMRGALLYDMVANIPLMGMWFLISVLLCCLGVHIVYKNENGYVKIV